MQLGQIKIGDQYFHSFKVTREVYEGFIRVFKDRNPLHTNAQFAQNLGFEREVMHGNILNGFLSFFVGTLLPIKTVIILSQSIKFHKPVYLDDELHFQAEIKDVFESVSMVEMSFAFTRGDQEMCAKGILQIGIKG